jgi:hypothetical protein
VLLPMIALIATGLLLLIGAPLISRIVRGRGTDTVGLTRILQAVAIVLLVVALVIRPRNIETSAVPPPPDSVEEPAP